MIFTLPDIDQETLDELLESIGEMLDEVEPALTLLADQPDNVTTLNELFRNLHTIKGNFRMCFIDPLTDYMHVLEELISQVRNQRLRYDSAIKEACTMAIDRMRDQLDALIKHREIETNELDALAYWMESMAHAEQNELVDLCEKFRQAMADTSPRTAVQPSHRHTSSSSTTQPNLQADLASFGMLARKLEERVPHWQGHFEIMLLLTNAALPHLPWALDRTQMNAAIYLHDIGMSTVSRAITAKTGVLSNEERQQLHKHPKLAWQYLSRQPEWSDAAQIVLQHHERPDGRGYPQGLKGDDIHPGAKLLAVIDAFTSIIHERPDRITKRNAFDALKEISEHSGAQFDPVAVKVLVKIAKPLFIS